MRPWMMAVIGTAAALAGCKQRSQLYCCLSEATCNEEGGAGHIVMCTDPGRPFCDEQGQYPASEGVEHTCIPDPFGDGGMPDAGTDAAPDCEDSSECTTATAPICSPEGACTACTSGATGDADCAAKDSATPRCADSGACVECLDSEDDCTSAAEPVCDSATNTCRACQAHDECASEVCELAIGECVPTGDIVYVATNGADGAGCGTFADPCDTIGGAQGGLAKVSISRTWVKVRAGSYVENVNVNDTSFTLIGAGADVAGAAGNDPVIDILGNSTVTIEGLRIHDGLGAAGDGVRCNQDVDSPQVTLREVTIDANTGQGMDADSCVVVFERSRIIANVGGGVSLTNCEFSLVNNFIVKNGGITGTIGGVALSQVSAAGTHELAFNTVSGNGGATDVITGVSCASITTPLPFANNIVYGNPVLGTGTQVGGDADCTWTYSDIEGGQAGTGNINMNPLFVNTTTNDYHLMGTSPARNAADPAATETVDIDGQARDEGGTSDMGADEVRP